MLELDLVQYLKQLFLEKNNKIVCIFDKMYFKKNELNSSFEVY